MVGPREPWRALVRAGAVGGATLLALASPAPTQAATRADVATAAPTPDEAPLRVTITSMTPGSLPATGRIRITGTVTNRTDETWTDISLYAFAGDSIDDVPVEPMRTPAALAAAMDTPYDEVVGERLVDEGGRNGEVAELAPGAEAEYRITVPASAIEVSRPGVYWFGVHALGTSSTSPPGDATADGRARTFLPYVPPRIDEPVQVALVVPVTTPVQYDANGSVSGVDSWTQALGPGGRLSNLLDLGEGTGGPVTWLVDPALVDAVARLAAGNPPRSLGPARRAGGGTEGTDGTSPSGPATPGGEPTDPADPDLTDPALSDPDLTDPGSGEEGEEGTDGAAAPEPTPSVRAASDWLERLRDALGGDEVLTLPYGNIDVAAVLDTEPRLLDIALAQSSPTLSAMAETEPVIASPHGFLDADTVRAASPETHLLVTDRALEGRPPATLDADGHLVTVTSSGATDGSPGPGTWASPVGLRQRLLAEAAVRAVRPDRSPLVVVLPSTWGVRSTDALFDGLDAPWLDLDTLDEVEAAAAASGAPEPLSAEDLRYGPVQRRLQLDDDTVRAAGELVDAGDTLQNVLADNTTIGGTVTEEALTGLSYAVRNNESLGRYTTGRSRDWVDDQLGRISISAAAGVTLASDTGQFVVTLTTDLAHTVVVGVRADTDDGIQIEVPDRVELAPGSRQTVVVEARTTTSAVHRVRLVVTDQDGRPLGAAADLPIRSTAVSGVIWVIMGIGGGLLFLAIVVRLVRRIRAARSGDPSAGRRANHPEPEEPRPAVEVG